MNAGETTETTARWLQAGDVLVGSGFVVAESAYRGVHTPKGKVWVRGNYPGSPVKRYEWAAGTMHTVIR